MPGSRTVEGVPRVGDHGQRRLRTSNPDSVPRQRMERRRLTGPKVVRVCAQTGATSTDDAAIARVSAGPWRSANVSGRAQALLWQADPARQGFERSWPRVGRPCSRAAQIFPRDTSMELRCMAAPVPVRSGGRGAFRHASPIRRGPRGERPRVHARSSAAVGATGQRAERVARAGRVAARRERAGASHARRDRRAATRHGPDAVSVAERQHAAPQPRPSRPHAQGASARVERRRAVGSRSTPRPRAHKYRPFRRLPFGAHGTTRSTRSVRRRHMSRFLWLHFLQR